jgi:hypothetical protein
MPLHSNVCETSISGRAIMRSPPPASRRTPLTDHKKAHPMVALSTRALFWIAKINLALLPSQQDLAEALALADHERSGYPWWTASGARSYAYNGSPSRSSRAVAVHHAQNLHAGRPGKGLRRSP